ncbi:MAG: hypothetical protein ACO201_01515 [Rickettsiales bacterium]
MSFSFSKFPEFQFCSTILTSIGNFFNCCANKDMAESREASPINSSSNSSDTKLSRVGTSVNVGEGGGLILSRSSLTSTSTSTFELTSTSEFSIISSISSKGEGSINSSFSDFSPQCINKISDQKDLQGKYVDQPSLPLNHITGSSPTGTSRHQARTELRRPKEISRSNLPGGQRVGLVRPPAYTEVPSFPDNPDEASKSLSVYEPNNDLPAKIMLGRDLNGKHALSIPLEITRPNRNQSKIAGLGMRPSFTMVRAIGTQADSEAEKIVENVGQHKGRRLISF